MCVRHTRRITRGLLLGLVLAATPGPSLARERAAADPWLALTVSGVTVIEARRARLPTPQGTYIHHCGPGSMGEAAGLRTGDVVLEIEVQPAEPPQQLLAYLTSKQPGERVQFKVWRDRAIVVVDRPMGGRMGTAVAAPVATASAAAAAGEPAPTVAAPPATLALEPLRVVPGTVAAGGHFALEISFTATDPGVSAEPLSVSLSYAIERDGETLFAPGAETITATNGQRWHVVKNLAATRAPGEYFVRVELRLGSQAAQSSTRLTVN
jgi:hypothetical protein